MQEAERGKRRRAQRKLRGIIRKAENQNELTTKDIEKNEKNCKNVHSKSKKRISIPAINYNCKMLTKKIYSYFHSIYANTGVSLGICEKQDKGARFKFEIDRNIYLL